MAVDPDAQGKANTALAALNPAPSLSVASPYDVIATAGAASGVVDVQWVHRQPASVTSYLVTPAGGAPIPVQANGRVRQNMRITGLANGTPITVTVQAIGLGGGSLLIASNTVTPTALPSTLLGGDMTGLFFLWDAALQAQADSSAATQLTDFSGNGYNAAAEAAGATYRANYGNGKPSVAMPGTARFTTKGLLTPGLRSPRETYYAIYSVAAAPGSGQLAGGRVLSTETPFTALSSNSYSIGFAISTGYGTPARTCAIVDRSSALPGSGSETLSAGTALNTPIVAIASRPGSAEVDGTDLGIALASVLDVRPLMVKNRALGTTPTGTDDTGYVFGGVMGGRYTQGLQGDLLALLMFSGTHSPAQRALVKAYAAARKSA